MDRTFVAGIAAATIAFAVFIGGVSFWVQNYNNNYFAMASSCITGGGTWVPVKDGMCLKR